jgi:GDPmannose 4,6-dehydratase
MFGITLVEPQNENLGFNPVSPYGTSKVMALESCRQYRENGFYVSSAIMYNHESIHRPTQYVTRKISRTVAAIANGQADKLSIGNLQVQRDWGYASDYMQAAFLMLQQKVPNDYIIATGIVHSVQDLISMAFAEVGLGGRESEFLLIDEGLMRPREISRLIGDSSKARIDLGWEPTKPFAEVFRHMVLHDLSLLGN